MTPQRIQLRRTRGWRLPTGAINVARPTRWGNPFAVGDDVQVDALTGDEAGYSVTVPLTAAIAVAMYRDLMDTRLTHSPHETEGDEDWRYVEHWRRSLELLAGRDLACWCPLEDADGNRVPCHADVLLELANPGWQP